MVVGGAILIRSWSIDFNQHVFQYSIRMRRLHMQSTNCILERFMVFLKSHTSYQAVEASKTLYIFGKLSAKLHCLRHKNLIAGAYAKTFWNMAKVVWYDELSRTFKWLDFFQIWDAWTLSKAQLNGKQWKFFLLNWRKLAGAIQTIAHLGNMCAVI